MDRVGIVCLASHDARGKAGNFAACINKFPKPAIYQTICLSAFDANLDLRAHTQHDSMTALALKPCGTGASVKHRTKC